MADLPAVLRKLFVRNIEGALSPKHRGRSMPEASRVLFTSDEEHSLRAMQERLYSVFMFSLLCDHGRMVFVLRSLAHVFTVPSCFPCFVSEMKAFFARIIAIYFYE